MGLHSERRQAVVHDPRRRSRLTRAFATVAAAAAAVAVLAAEGLASPPATARRVDRALCPFPLEVDVTRSTGSGVGTSVLRFEFGGPIRIRLRNTVTGKTAVLSSAGAHTVDTRTGTVTFEGHQVWSWATAKGIPFLSTEGTGRFVAPTFVLGHGSSRSRVIDPCARVATSPPETAPRRTRAPWGLPGYALSRIGYAGLTPLLGRIVRHEHVHLDVVVDGRKVAVPAGVGLAEPVDGGPCPPSPDPQGDCVTGHIFAAAVANSPLHTHSSSGLIHVEADRSGTFTLGQFFDEWGVRLDSRCIGGSCAGRGRELRAYVNGRRFRGDPRAIVLGNRQEIAVVFGKRADFTRIPRYTKGWPGQGCGGAGEPRC